MSSSIKQMRVVANADLTGKCLEDLVSNENINPVPVERLLKAMCSASQPVKAVKLGFIGEEALTRRIVDIDGVVPETVRYFRKGLDDALRPTGIEVVFGLRPETKGETRVRFGLNFSPALNIPISSLPAWLQSDALIDPDDAACLNIHVTSPRFEFASRSKSMLV